MYTTLLSYRRQSDRQTDPNEKVTFAKQKKRNHSKMPKAKIFRGGGEEGGGAGGGGEGGHEI